MVRYEVRIEDSGDSYQCADDRSLLAGMESLGKKGIPVGCRNGGCGVCKVQIVSGTYVARVMSRAHVSEEDERSGCVLSCRVRPTSAIVLRVLGAFRKAVLRPAAGAPSQGRG